MPRADHTKDIASVRRQAAEGGLRFEAYLPPGLAAWVIGLVEQEIFHSCGSRKPVAPINRQVGARVITPLAAHSDDATRPLPGLP
jgi:hypothetical protein